LTTLGLVNHGHIAFVSADSAALEGDVGAPLLAEVAGKLVTALVKLVAADSIAEVVAVCTAVKVSVDTLGAEGDVVEVLGSEAVFNENAVFRAVTAGSFGVERIGRNFLAFVVDTIPGDANHVIGILKTIRLNTIGFANVNTAGANRLFKRNRHLLNTEKRFFFRNL